MRLTDSDRGTSHVFVVTHLVTRLSPQEVLRNDRTPLNTPYTPQLVKLHLKRHDEYEQQQHESEQARTPVARQFVSSLKSKLFVLAHPVQRIRYVMRSRCL